MFYFFQEDRQKRLGPGGLDPVEVFESLPLVSMLSSVSTDRAYSCLGDLRLDFCALGSYQTAPGSSSSLG